MPAEIELKLEDLAKIALGSSHLTNVNIAVLQSLIDILLKKLNCQNEKVYLSSYECQSLKKILEKSKISPLPFNDENVELIARKLQRVEKLEECIGKLDGKLDCHLKAVENAKRADEVKFHWEKWEDFGCEDLCATCDPENDLPCKLLKNTDFLKKLLRRVSAPMIERVFALEDKISLLSEEFTKFLAYIEQEYFKIQVLKNCIEELEYLRIKISENHAAFLCTMEEVQDMLDSKLDKLHVPALKKYIRDRFKNIEDIIESLQRQKSCPRAAGIVSNLNCLSCGSSKVCADVGVEASSLLPDLPKSRIRVSNASPVKDCGCDLAEGDDKTVGIIDLPQSLPCKDGNVLHKQVFTNPVRSCQGGFKEIEFLIGENGILFRKG